MGARLGGHRRGIAYALAAAALFGASTPLAKMLVGKMQPVILAGLLYLGSGIGLTALRATLRPGRREARLARKDLPWLGAAILLGGILAPVLLLWGLRTTPASAASLLLNFEGVGTAIVAWFVFREHFDRRIAVGMLLITIGGIVLSWSTGEHLGLAIGSIAVVSACFCWALDNNVTQKVSGADPLQIAAIKGVVAGLVNVGLAYAFENPALAALSTLFALLVGFLGYGVSLWLFVLALRSLGTARTAAYFSVAPFIGAAVSLVVVHEQPPLTLAAAAVLMASGVWLHVSERHVHGHRHERLAHSHSHAHDEHHRHSHDPSHPAGEPHTHEHVHEPMVHSHPHYPDIHHRHTHG